MRALAIILFASIPAPSVAQEISGDPQRGEDLFESIACYSCHGYDGTGMTPLSTKTSGALSSEAVFLTYMRLRGEKMQLVPSRRMPHYSQDVLSDDDARDLYAYLVTLEDDTPPIEEIPALKEILENAQESLETDERH